MPFCLEPARVRRRTHRQISIIQTDSIHASASAAPDGELDALKHSIARLGLLSPILVRARGGGYELVAGARRLAACRALGMEELECIVLPALNEECLLAALCENSCRRAPGAGRERELRRDLERFHGYTPRELELLTGARDAAAPEGLYDPTGAGAVAEPGGARSIAPGPGEDGAAGRCGDAGTRPAEGGAAHDMPGPPRRNAHGYIRDRRLIINAARELVSGLRATGMDARLDVRPSASGIKLEISVPCGAIGSRRESVTDAEATSERKPTTGAGATSERAPVTDVDAHASDATDHGGGHIGDGVQMVLDWNALPSEHELADYRPASDGAPPNDDASGHDMRLKMSQIGALLAQQADDYRNAAGSSAADADEISINVSHMPDDDGADRAISTALEYRPRRRSRHDTSHERAETRATDAYAGDDSARDDTEEHECNSTSRRAMNRECPNIIEEIRSTPPEKHDLSTQASARQLHENANTSDQQPDKLDKIRRENADRTPMDVSSGDENANARRLDAPARTARHAAPAERSASTHDVPALDRPCAAAAPSARTLTAPAVDRLIDQLLAEERARMA